MKYFETLSCESFDNNNKEQQQQRMNDAHFLITEQRQMLSISVKRKEEK